MGDVPRWDTLDAAIRHWAATRPREWAMVEPAGRLSWTAYDGYITVLAAHLLDLGLAPGDRVGVWLPDGVAVHVALSACLRAGLVYTGIGARSGRRELTHLLGRSGAKVLLTAPRMGDVDTRDLFAELTADLPTLTRYVPAYDVVPVPDGPVYEAAPKDVLAKAEQRIDGHHAPTDTLALLNSTSGTTGLPKCVAHDERRWIKYHDFAVDAGELTTDDVCMSVVPAPFGFGLWTAHFTPTLLGAPSVVLPRFSVTDTLRMLEQERVTVFMAVSTQFVMMLGDPGVRPLRPQRAARHVHRRRGGSGAQGGGVRAAHRKSDPQHVRLQRDRRAELHDGARPARQAADHRRAAHPRGRGATVRCGRS